MLESILSTFAGAVIFLFIFWKRLKEDYASEIVFSVSFYIFIGIFIGWLVSSNFLREWFLWVNFVGAIVGLYFGILRFRIKFFESFESLIIAGLPWLSFIFLADSVGRSSLSSFIAFLSILIFILFFITWTVIFVNLRGMCRKSRVCGLATLALILLARVVSSLMKVSVLSIVPKYDFVASGVGV